MAVPSIPTRAVMDFPGLVFSCQMNSPIQQRLPGWTNVQQGTECCKMGGRILFWFLIALQVRIQPPNSPMVVVAPGADITLPCIFSASEHLNLSNIIINWQQGNTVVHSFYHGGDQLERQGQTYKNRTRVFIDQILSGNASLSLTSVQPEDQGEYTCYVTSEQETTRGNVKLIMAAPYDEPVLSLQPTCDGINITATFSNGFPQPELRWLDSFGGVINESHSSFQLDRRGRYEVSSTMSFRSSTIERVTIEMTLEVISQSLTLSLHLHPLQDICQECCQTACTFRSRTPFALVVVLILIGLIVLVMVVIKKWKHRT
ncbi:CD276 antigen-like isoform X2 [Electrophorus electricus]|uniref:CD276 antigen-like isoform X2 n=2 Tax=Electrophorus electricus TaxID=8005 RepID=UPI0015D05E05|nr:CD276 antigen-like isoform X2 [Electrophorus electricus]